jgi:hypothetical protein
MAGVRGGPGFLSNESKEPPSGGRARVGSKKYSALTLPVT